MSEWVAVQKTKHKETRWVKHSNYIFTKTDAFVPVLLAELAELLPYYSLAFVAREQGFQLVALLSLNPGTNYYVTGEGKWRVAYVPSAYRSHPFMLAPKNANEYILCLDEASEFITLDSASDEGQKLFNEQGELTPPTAEILNFLQQCQANRQVTQQAVNLLAEHKLIIPWPIEQSQQDTTLLVKGIYQVDLTALKKLSGDALTQLSQHSALELAYAQVHSKPRLKNFEPLAKLHQQENSVQDVDLDQLFGEEGEDLLRF